MVEQDPSRIYASLTALRGVAVQLVFLMLATPEHPVGSRNGRLEEVRPDAVAITVEGSLPPLEPYIRFGVDLYGPTGLLHFISRPTGPVPAGATSVTLSLPKQVETVQRRGFARVPFSGEVLFQRLHNGRPLPGSKGLGIDLSASGIKMATSSRLTEGQEVLLHFQTPDGRIFRDIASRVVRVQQLDRWYTVACHFEALTEVQQDALVQAIFRMEVRSAAARR